MKVKYKIRILLTILLILVIAFFVANRDDIFSWQSFQVMAIILFVFSSPFLFIFLIQKKVLTKNKDDKLIIPILKPYKNIHPVIAGYILDHKLDVEDLLAGLFFLEQKGFVAIKKESDKYIFELKRNNIESLPVIDQLILDFIFVGDKKKVKFKDLVLSSQYTVMYLERYILDYLKDNEIIEKNNFKTFGKLFFIGIIFIIFSQTIHSYLKFGSGAIGSVFVLVGIGTLASHRFIPGKKYGEIKNNLDGFKKFLDMTEKERGKMFAFNDEHRDDLKYFPYAVAFGVEKKGIGKHNELIGEFIYENLMPKKTRSKKDEKK